MHHWLAFLARTAGVWGERFAGHWMPGTHDLAWLFAPHNVRGGGASRGGTSGESAEEFARLRSVLLECLRLCGGKAQPAAPPARRPADLRRPASAAGPTQPAVPVVCASACLRGSRAATASLLLPCALDRLTWRVSAPGPQIQFLPDLPEVCCPPKRKIAKDREN